MRHPGTSILHKSHLDDPKSALSADISNEKRVQWHDDAQPLIMEPSHARLSNDEIQNLFTEMCFYARLGFAQPPFCLQCTFIESNQSIPQQACPRLTVWRKNANTLLHPDKLEGNLVLVQCQAARQLSAGEQVDGYQWDKQSNLLLEP